MTQALFTPFKSGNLDLKNRLVMAPMTRYFSPNGVPTSDVAAYYRRRAEGEVGLIISEGTGINRAASLNHGPNLPRFFGDDALEGWQCVIDSVHDAKGKMAPQLWHVGSTPSFFPEWEVPAVSEGPSGYFAPGRPLGRAMTESDVADTIAAFALAAADAKRLGFDAIELHGAHGYLIDQFFWEGTNHRQDRFGGPTISQRVRFGTELVRAIRSAVGPGYPIVLRISQWKQQDYAERIAKTPVELEHWLSPLAEAGVDIFHCSQRRFWESEFEGSDLNLAGWAKKTTGKATITVGSVGLTGEFIAANSGEVSKPASLDELLRRLERGDFDLVAVGRAILQDPQWVQKIHEGRRDFLDFSKDAMQTLF